MTLPVHLLAQRPADMNDPNFLTGPTNDIVGTVTNPIVYGGLGFGVTQFFSNILRLIFVGGGVYALVNFILAGFQFMSAGGDAKAISAAWSRIWQTLLGLVFVIGSFALASLFGYLIFKDPGFILHPKVYGPK